MEPIPEVEDVDPEVDDPAVHDAVNLSKYWATIE